MAIDITNKQIWTSSRNELSAWVTAQLEGDGIELSIQPLKLFFIGHGREYVVDAITAEMQRCYAEKGLAIQTQRDDMYSIVEPKLINQQPEMISALQKPGVINTQPRAQALPDATAEVALFEPITFEIAKNNLALSFLKMVYEYDDESGFPETDSLAQRIASNLYGMPVLEIETVITLIAQAICRCYYEFMVGEAPSEQRVRFNCTADRYFICFKCTMGGAIFPGVLLTMPAVADFMRSLSWHLQAALPGIFLTLGLLLNEIICLNTCQCGQCNWLRHGGCCGIPCCQPPNHEQDNRRFAVASRAQQDMVKRQWTMLCTSCFGTTAQTLMPILRESWLVGKLSATTIASVTSLPVLIGVNLLSCGISYLLVNALQRQGYATRSPLYAVVGVLHQCYGHVIGGPCCFDFSHRGYAQLP